MALSSFVIVGFVTVLAGAACTPASALETNAERTAACTDRTNNTSCQACCKTEKNTFEPGPDAGPAAPNVCLCKGKVVP